MPNKMNKPIKNYVFLTSCLLYVMFQTFTVLSVLIYQRKLKGTTDDYLKGLWKGQYSFFTIWTYVLQMIFVATAILDEIGKLWNAPKSIQKQLGQFRTLFFHTLVLPCSIVVVSIFWSIWHIDRELIFPRVIDSFLPSWVNHSLHTFIILPVVTELLLPKRYNVLRFSTAAKILTAFLFIYQAVYLSIYFLHGVWLYPIYKILSWPQRVLFTLFQLGLGLFYLKVGIVIQDVKEVNTTKKVK